MSTRIFNIVVLALALTACENRPDNGILAEAEQRAASRAGDDGRIECAINGASGFSRDCYTERLSGENGVTMIIRHPDGGFRRFNVLTDGRGLEAADGFDKANISIAEDGRILVSVGPDQYLLPARIKAEEETATAGSTSTTSEDPAQAGN
jgi:hypothetical protein|tara:strand:+ start:32160 stop:32612 length:453 start_codon:yes stop_codon:yes gene_type:complete